MKLNPSEMECPECGCTRWHVFYSYNEDWCIKCGYKKPNDPLKGVLVRDTSLKDDSPCNIQ